MCLLLLGSALACTSTTFLDKDTKRLKLKPTLAGACSTVYFKYWVVFKVCDARNRGCVVGEMLAKRLIRAVPHRDRNWRETPASDTAVEYVPARSTVQHRYRTSSTVHHHGPDRRNYPQ